MDQPNVQMLGDFNWAKNCNYSSLPIWHLVLAFGLYHGVGPVYEYSLGGRDTSPEDSTA